MFWIDLAVVVVFFGSALLSGSKATIFQRILVLVVVYVVLVGASGWLAPPKFIAWAEELPLFEALLGGFFVVSSLKGEKKEPILRRGFLWLGVLILFLVTLTATLPPGYAEWPESALNLSLITIALLFVVKNSRM